MVYHLIFSTGEKTGPSNFRGDVHKRKSKLLQNERPSSSEPEMNLPTINDWANDFVSEEDRNNFAMSNKLMLLVAIIKKCEQIGDKLFVFQINYLFLINNRK